MGIVYILKSIPSGKYYIGSATDLDNRLNEHRTGHVKSTRFLRPYELVFHQGFDNIKKARQIEYKLKQFKNKNIIDKIIQEGCIRLRIDE